MNAEKRASDLAVGDVFKVEVTNTAVTDRTPYDVRITAIEVLPSGFIACTLTPVKFVQFKTTAKVRNFHPDTLVTVSA